MASPTNSQSPSLLKRFLKLATSLRLAAVLLALLTLLTLFGTLNQIDESIFHTQKKYFESAWVVDEIGGFPVFMPAGYLLLAVLFINMLFGTLIKLRQNWKSVGLYTVHFSILFLIVSAAVTKHFSVEGNMALYPGTQGNEVLSFHHWQMEIIPVDEEGKAEKALVIPWNDLKKIGWEGGRTFSSADLPFDIKVNRFAVNSQPIPASAPISAQSDGKEIDGFKLLKKPLEKEAEANTAGAYVEFIPKEGNEETEEAILFAHLGANFVERTPYPVEMGGKTYGVQIARERFQVPFTVRVDEFIFKKYAGVSTAKNYQSNITKIEDGTEEAVVIKMNEPMRHKGYTFFQASFGPRADAPPEQLYPVFQVVRNPSDHWPLVSMIVLTIGLLFHLLLKLFLYLNKASKKKSSTPPPYTGDAKTPGDPEPSASA